jgi:hypothetical protein
MNREGFYRIIWDYQPGIGFCRHHTLAVHEETYENWNLMIIRGVPGDPHHIATLNINSTSDNFKSLVVGKPIRGLPTKFRDAP